MYVRAKFTAVVRRSTIIHFSGFVPASASGLVCLALDV